MIKKLILFFVLLLFLQSCYVGRFFIYNFADVRDYKKFPKTELHKSETPFYFINGSQSSNIRLPKTVKGKHKTYSFESALKKTGTVSFIIIRNDSILYQWLRPGKDNGSITTTFSMSKSFLSALIGIAIEDGYIHSVEDSITNYLDFLDKNEFGKVTIQDVLDMRSGIKFGENYFNPFGDIAKYYYGTHLKKYMKHLKMESEPGKKFRYISLNTQLLALILEKATGKTPTAYLQEKLWTPLGMEYDATWSVDSKKNKTEKAFCCINGRAIDYAKLGRLYLNKGLWNGRQIVSKEWVEESTTFKYRKNNFVYSNHWWHTRDHIPAKDSVHIDVPYYIDPYANIPNSYVVKPSGDFFAQGLLGQYLYMYPEKNIIIVRMSKREGRNLYWPELFKDIARNN
jgi:CubicO group peptidase (beta-lactamase class C family)